MATQAEVSKVILVLNALYPHQAIGKGLNEKGQAVKVAESSGMWHQILGDIPYNLLSLAVRQVAASGREFYPPAGVIRQAALDLAATDADRLTAGEAWAEARKAIGYPNHEWSNPLVKKAFEAIGGWSYFRHALESSQAADRARFIQAFEQLQSNAEADRRMLPAIRGFVGQRRQIQAESSLPSLPEPEPHDRVISKIKELAELKSV